MENERLQRYLRECGEFHVAQGLDCQGCRWQMHCPLIKAMSPWVKRKMDQANVKVAITPYAPVGHGRGRIKRA